MMNAREEGDDRKQQGAYHAIRNLPHGGTPYVRAKHFQLVKKDPEAAVALFWEAINTGDRVDSALKDMAVVLKQQDKAEEAIETIQAFRGLCSKQAQESLDNVLIDLYRKCGRLEEQIELLKQKLRMIYQGESFNGKSTKTARSHGRKFRVTVKKETSRILGNLGWAYMQLGNFVAAEAVYRKAQMIGGDGNKACNLGFCLMKQGRCDEAKAILEEALQGELCGCENTRSRSRARELLRDLELRRSAENSSSGSCGGRSGDAFEDGLGPLEQSRSFRSKRLPIFEEISPFDPFTW